MSWFSSVVSVDDRLQADLQRRLDKLARVFDLAAVMQDPLPAERVVEYYENCQDAYRKYHSKEGAVHMALNEGNRFDADGFYGQVQRMCAAWPDCPPADLLELAFGQGFNLAWLGKRYPGCRFTGIDLTPGHVAVATERVRQMRLANVFLQQGDYHQLPYADASFDEVLAVEAFCHALDPCHAFTEVARVLRPGGRFTLFDGYLQRPAAELPEAQALAVDLVARGMAIERLQVQAELLEMAEAAGLQTLAAVPLDRQVMPTLRRLERTTGAVIRWPWLGRRALAKRHPARGRNVLAGYLMRCTVEMGLIGYRHLILQKAR